MPAIRSDLRHALRQLRRRPGFACLAVVSLAIGIGAPTVVFTAVDATLLRPLPVKAADRLVEGYRTDSDGTGFHSFSYRDADELAKRTRSLSGLAATDADLVSLGTGGEPTMGIAGLVTGNYFDVLGATPELGRFFAVEEDGPATARSAVVVSDAFWRSRLGANPSAIGARVAINGIPFTVIGVARASFAQASAIVKPDVWTTIGTARFTIPHLSLDRWTVSTFELVGRLRPGVEPTAAAHELSAIQRTIDAEHPEAGSGHGVQLFPLTSVPAEVHGALGPLLALLMAFAGLITLVACGNVASMLLARGLERRGEIAVRGALGASRSRLVSQITTETVVVFLFGGAAAVGLAYAATLGFSRFHPQLGVPITFELPMDWRVLSFALALALAVGVASGLLPALRSTRSDLAAVLKSEAGRLHGRSRGRSVLVAGQIGFTFVLLVGAGLVVRALSRAVSLDPGFRHADVQLATTDLDMARLTGSNAVRTADAWATAVAAAPGVERVALTTRAPLSLGNSTMGFTTGPVPAVGSVDWKDADFAAVSPGYFDALAIPLVTGRAFARSDDSTSQPVVIVSVALARHYFRSPALALGQTIRVGRADADRLLIVGVARDSKVRSTVEAPRDMLYRPLAQSAAHRVTLLAASSRPDADQVIRKALHDVSPALPIVTLMRFDDYMGVSLLPQRLAAGFATVLGIAGLVLASVGVYGIVMYGVMSRRREIGIRMAVGATPSNVVATMAGSGLRLLGAGIGVGVVLAVIAARAMGAFLLGVSPFDVATFAAAIVGVGAVGLAATALPASRAARVDPVSALRSD